MAGTAGGAGGALVSGWVGPLIFRGIFCNGATRGADGLLRLVPGSNAQGWLVLTAVGFVSAFSLWLYNRWLERTLALETSSARV